jgi:protein TonB
MKVSGINLTQIKSTTARLLSSAVVGLTVTAGLLYLMVVLIANTEVVITESRQFEFCWMCLKEPRPEMAPAEPPVPIKPPLPEPTPDFMLPPQTIGDEIITISHGPPLPGMDFDESAAPGYGDGSLTLILKVKPVYPPTALVDGVEGYTIVEYNVTTAGTVHDAWIVESSDPVFDEASVDAVNKFLFSPRMIHGIPQETQGLKNMFKFEIQKRKK